MYRNRSETRPSLTASHQSDKNSNNNKKIHQEYKSFVAGRCDRGSWRTSTFTTISTTEHRHDVSRKNNNNQTSTDGQTVRLIIKSLSDKRMVLDCLNVPGDR